MFNPLPKLPTSDSLQICIFIVIFFLSAGSIINGFLSISYLLNNALVLILCLMTIIYPLSVKLHYIFGYGLIISVVLDIIVTIYNWPPNSYGLRVFPFILQIIYMAFKLFVSILELQTAKTLNDEPRLPITFIGDIFDLTKSQSLQTQSQAHFQASRPQGGPQGGPRAAQQPPTTKSSQVNESLPPYQVAAASTGRSDLEKSSSYQEGGLGHTTTTTITTTTQKYDDHIVSAHSNVDDL